MVAGWLRAVALDGPQAPGMGTVPDEATRIAGPRRDEEGGPRRRWWERPWVLGAVVLAVLAIPLVVTLAVLAEPRWYPSLDMAQTELRVRDVPTSDAPLIGLAGRIGTEAQQGSHPGPLSFWALWPFYALFGSSSWALQAAAAALNLVAVGLTLWLAHRRGGVPLLLGAGVALALVLRAYGPELLTEAWNPYLPMLWWVAFLFAAWSVAARDRVALPVAVFAGSYCMQTHISYLGLVAGFVGLGVLVLGFQAWRDRSDGAARRRTLLWVGGSAALGLLLWLPPVAQELTTDRGNLSIIRDHFSDPPEEPIGFGEGVEVMLRELNPVRLGSHVLADSWVVSPTLIPGAVVLLVWLLAVAMAWRLRHRELLRLHAVLGLTVVLGVASIARIFGIRWHYLSLWTFSTCALLLLATAWTAAGAVRARRGPMTARGARLGGLALAGVIAAWSLSFAIGEAPDARLRDAHDSVGLAALVPSTVEALTGGDLPGNGEEGRYLVTWNDPVGLGAQGYGMVSELERAGFHAGTIEPFRERATEHRAFDAADADARVHMQTSRDPQAWPERGDAVAVASFDPRSDAEREEFERLRSEVVEGLVERGADDELVVKVDENLFGASLDERIPERLRGLMVNMLDLGLPTTVFVGEPA